MTEIKKNSFVIVRARDAGVHAGYYQRHEGREVELTNAIRLWRWWSHLGLSDLATNGVLKGKEPEVRFTTPAKRIIIGDACEIILCTAKGKKSIEGIKPWRQTPKTQ